MNDGVAETKSRGSTHPPGESGNGEIILAEYNYKLQTPDFRFVRNVVHVINRPKAEMSFIFDGGVWEDANKDATKETPTTDMGNDSEDADNAASLQQINSPKISVSKTKLSPTSNVSKKQIGAPITAQMVAEDLAAAREKVSELQGRAAPKVKVDGKVLYK